MIRIGFLRNCQCVNPNFACATVGCTLNQWIVECIDTPSPFNFSFYATNETSVYRKIDMELELICCCFALNLKTRNKYIYLDLLIC